MSWIKRHPLLVLGALALALRVTAAVVTEFNPIFPPYYYTDARIFQETAVSALNDAAQGRPPIFKGPRSVRVQSFLLYELYRLTGPRPLAAKLANAVLGAAGVMVLAWMLMLAFPASVALISGLLVAVWPSHVFYTSQNLKEAPSNLLAYAALACAFAAGDRTRHQLLFAAGAGVAMIGAGFFRPPVLAAIAAALIAALALAACRGRRLPALATFLAVVAALVLYSRLSRGTDAYESQLIPAFSPAALTQYRDVQEQVGHHMALTLNNREIATSIFPDAKFRTWGDILVYLPKGSFYVLFMPLPGLYPMDGKIGRLAASGENILLLLIAALAAVGIARGPLTPERFGLLAFFAVLTAGSALLEFDLGGAGRHKLLYLPMLFPFAVEEARRLWDRS